MATYKEVNGTAVQNYAGTYPGAVDGELWYNSTATTSQFQYGATAAAWATGNNLNTARGSLAGAGTQTAGLAFGGEPTPNATEEYNGTAWTGGGNLPTAKSEFAGAGTQTAGLAFGGNYPIVATTELYDGSSWTTTSSMNTARRYLAGAGSQAAGLAFGGTLADNTTRTAATEEYSTGGPATVTISGS